MSERVIERMRLPELSYVTEHGLPRPQWPPVEHAIEGVADEVTRAQLWTDAKRAWLEHLAAAMPECPEVVESQSFLTLAPELCRDKPSLARFAEHCRAELLRRLPTVARFVAPGKLVIIIAPTHDSYYDYTAPFMPEREDGGEYGGSGGMQIRDDVQHIATWWVPHAIHRTIAHELTHSALERLQMPQWIEEGLAQMFEQDMTTRQTAFTAEDRAKHLRFWRRHTLEPLWFGEGFYRPDQGQRLTYQLAEILVRLLAEEHRPRWFGWDRSRTQRLLRFFRYAKREDAGEAGAQEHLGFGLGALAARCLGPGPWSTTETQADTEWSEEVGDEFDD